MKKRQTDEKILNKLYDAMPARTVFRLHNEDIPNCTHNKVLLKKAQPQELLGTMVSSTQEYLNSEKEIPKFSYIINEKRDGMLASGKLYRELLEKGFTPVYNPVINENCISDYVSKKRLKEEAVDAGFLDKKPIPLWKTVISLITGIGSAIGLAAQFLEFFSQTDSGFIPTLFSVLKNDLGIVFIACALGFLIVTASIIFQHLKNNKDFFEELDRALAKLNDEAFLSFLERFYYEDFTIADCKLSSKRKPVFVCNLDSYNLRQRHVLKALWTDMSLKQIWHVFVEETNLNQSFILEHSDEQDVFCYCMLRLSIGQKRELAKAVCSDSSASLINDAGMRNYGADYVCRHLIKEKSPVADAATLNGRIQEFVKLQNADIRSSVPFLIRFVADLNCSYDIDFTKRWEGIFDAYQDKSELVALDTEISKRILNTEGTNIKSLVQEIINTFSDDFEEISSTYKKEEQITEHTQWTLIKALRHGYSVRDSIVCEDLCTAISDTLTYQFRENEYSTYWSDPVWVGILKACLDFFYRSQYLWYLPILVNNIVRIYGTNYTTGIYTAALPIARANMILNVNASDESFDLIRDHFTVAIGASYESNANLNLDNSVSVPESFALLNLTSAERTRYYNALLHLNDTVSMEYYRYMFDIYATTLWYIDSRIRFCYTSLYTAPVHEKYLKPDGSRMLYMNDYIAEILRQLISFLQLNFSADLPDVSKELIYLENTLNNFNGAESARKFVMQMARLDILSTVTLSFIVCTMARLNGSINISNDFYLDLGNYHTATVFLTYNHKILRSRYSDDYSQLIGLLTKYIDPCDTTLSFLCVYERYHQPESLLTNISDYLTHYQEKYVRNLLTVVDNIKVKDIDSFLDFVSFTGNKTIPVEQKSTIYLALEKKIRAEYMSSPKAPIYLEFISIAVHGHSSEEFEVRAPIENIQLLLEASNDLIYAIFHHYFYYDREKYFELVPMVIKSLLSSSACGKINIVNSYAWNSKHSDSDSFRDAMHYAYNALDSDMVQAQNLSSLGACAQLFSFFRQRMNNEEWYDADRIAGLELLTEAERSKKLTIQAKIYFTHRSWRKYGIIYFMIYLINNVNRSFFTPNDYDPEKKLEYFTENFKRMTPTVIVDGSTMFNQSYYDMLVAFVNNTDDIQNKFDNIDTYKKFINDCLSLAKSTPYLDSAHRDEIIQLIDQYSLVINRA